MRLTLKQRLFVEEYLTCWNAAEAARRAGYSAKTAKVIGTENLTKPAIRAVIDQRLAERAMSADEVLARLSAQASASLADFITITGEGDKRTAVFDLVKAVESGKAHLIKKISFMKGRLEVELYDAQAALHLLGKHHRLFTDRIEFHDWRKQAADTGIDPDQLYNQVLESARQLLGEGAPKPTP